MRYITKNNIKIKKRSKKSRKGDNGEVLVIGGSEDYVGCVALAGLAALRTGADWVTVASPEKTAWAISCLTPDLITKKIKGKFFRKSNAKKIVELSKKFDSVLIGNGIGIKKETKEFVGSVVKTKKLKVIDADGIKAIGIDDFNDSIITPHAKELELFLKNSRINKEMIKKIIKEKNIEKKALLIKKTLKTKIKKNILIVKGPVDIILSKDKILYNKTGNPGMTKGGSGDVLAGLAAGFLAQSRDLLQSAVNAAYFNGLIGDILLKKKKGPCFIASDMVSEIKFVLDKNNT